MRLIDADAGADVLQRMAENYRVIGMPADGEGYATMARTLRNTVCFPTIDAVPVVRCRQCAQAKRFHNPTMGDLILCNEYRVFTDDDGFCHKGAKMDGGAESEKE